MKGSFHGGEDVESCFNPPNNEQLFMFILCFILYFLFDVAVGCCSS